MRTGTSVAMLLARLRLTVPEARSVLVASARSSVDVSTLAMELAESAAASGLSVTLIDVRGTEGRGCSHATTQSEAKDEANPPLPGRGSVHRIRTGEASNGNAEALKQALAASERFCVLLGAGLLDSAATLLAVPAVDVVVVVAQRGKTARADLERSRLDIEGAGGRLAGAVLVK